MSLSWFTSIQPSSFWRGWENPVHPRLLCSRQSCFVLLNHLVAFFFSHVLTHLSEIPFFCLSEPPQVRVELQQQDVAWGDTVRFSCQVRGKPTPTVVWLHNSQPLSPSPRHRVTSQVLRVLHVGPQDDGMYQCMAENGVGSSQAATRLLTVPTGIKHFIKNHYYYYYFFSFIYFNFIQFFKILYFSALTIR